MNQPLAGIDQVLEGDYTSCILPCGKLCVKASDSISSTERWETIKKKALLWSGLDKFGDVYTTVDWDNGPAGQYVLDSWQADLVQF